MNTAESIVEILKREGVSTMFCFPTTSLIETAVAAGIRPIICRQERVGVDAALWPSASLRALREGAALSRSPGIVEQKMIIGKNVITVQRAAWKGDDRQKNGAGGGSCWPFLCVL